MRRYLFSLQAKLIAAFVIVVVVALVLSGGAFLVLRHNDQETRALDKVVAASPAIFGEFSVRALRGDNEVPLQTFVEREASNYGVRILLLDSTGVVAEDSGGSLEGKQITIPAPATPSPTSSPVPGAGPGGPGGPRLPGRSYYSWNPQPGTPGEGLILLTSNLPTVRLAGTNRQGILLRGTDNYTLILGVPQETITRAWLGLLPGLGFAAIFALPVAVILAIFISRYITRPIHQLTLASQRMAEGTFDIEVSTKRSDEVGQLARAFVTMAERVGGTQRQMRTLVADVSHDLKTPLTSIFGFARALHSGKAADEAEVQRMGAVIEEEASRLSARLSDLLYLSEIESGQAMLDTDQIDLGRLVNSVATRVFASGLRPNVHLEISCPDGTEVSADAAKLERAMENLLDNARKFTPADGQLSLRTWREAGPRGQACVEVANSAPEVDPAELPRLFERFYRRDRARTDRTSGSGLGLPIARDIVALHGGTLDASIRDEMLVFTVRLPAS
jgi:signal transduction histidine kinase